VANSMTVKVRNIAGVATVSYVDFVSYLDL
jgi:hypothetical protein